MADTPKHSVSVAGIVVDDQDRILAIQRRDNGHWEPPGGVLELSETPEQGVRREVLEETGIVVEVEGLSGVYKNMTQSVVALVFRCHASGGSIQQTNEAVTVQWKSLSELIELMNEAYAVRVLDAVDDRGTYVHVREHDGVRIRDYSTRS